MALALIILIVLAGGIAIGCMLMGGDGD